MRLLKKKRLLSRYYVAGKKKRSLWNPMKKKMQKAFPFDAAVSSSFSLATIPNIVNQERHEDILHYMKYYENDTLRLLEVDIMPYEHYTLPDGDGKKQHAHDDGHDQHSHHARQET